MMKNNERKEIIMKSETSKMITDLIKKNNELTVKATQLDCILRYVSSSQYSVSKDEIFAIVGKPCAAETADKKEDITDGDLSF
jgi:hypothetical protein